MDPALWELLRASTEDHDDREVECIIRLDRPDVDVAGVRLLARFGHVATGRVWASQVLAVRQNPRVVSLKATRSLLEEPDLTADVDVPPGTELPVRMVPGDARRPATDLTGRGVLVGFVDWGIDFDHPNLKNPDGTTRLVALWDQRDGGPPGGTPQPYGYGTVHDRDRLNAALRTSDPYGALGYHPGIADKGGGAHGTHVCDIAAGNGRNGGPVGLAPEADIAFVHMAQRGTGGLANLGDSVRLLEAIDWLFQVAGDRPCVVNCSLGRHGGPHDGRTLTELALDERLTTTPNRAVVLSTGNYFAKPVHASSRLAPGESRTLTMVVDEDDHTSNEMEIWYDGEDELVVQVESPTGWTSPPVPLGRIVDIDEDDRVVGRLYHRAWDPNNGDHHIDLFLYPSASPGAWRVTVQATAKVRHGVFHAWIERDQACEPCQATFTSIDADRRSTTGTIANGHLPLVVGAYDAHSVDRAPAPFSSSGPTRDGRQKPDLVAPGYQILAARSAPPGAERSPGDQVRKSGTSMAAPHATGATALCLQAAAPRRLRMREIRSLVLGTTQPAGRAVTAGIAPPLRQDPAGLRLGHGYLDVDRLLAAASALGDGARRRITSPRHEPKEEDDMSYEMDLEAELTPAEQTLWRSFVGIPIAAGVRDRNDLTNLVFFARHRERDGRALRRDEPDFGPLSREWLQIRDTVVAPALSSSAPRPPAASPTPPASPSTPTAPASATGAGDAKPLAIVSTRFAGALHKEHKYGVPETVRALEWISQEWAATHPKSIKFRVTSISKLGGGEIDHKSHRIGLDVDANISVDGTRLVYGEPGYASHQHLMQELVDLIRRNPVLPVQVMFFNDPQIYGDPQSGVRYQPGHENHVHIRFCRPAKYATALDLDLVYAPGEKKPPSYACATGATQEDAFADLDESEYEFDESEYEFDESEYEFDESEYEFDDLDEDDEAFNVSAGSWSCGCHKHPPMSTTRDEYDEEAVRVGLRRVAPRPERVVFVPGLMGTSLIDTSLTPDEARKLCEKHLGKRDKWLRGTALYPCDKVPEALWGEVGMLHWLYAPEEWGQRMRVGDGWNKPGSIRPGRLVDIEAGRFEVKRYTRFLDALRKEGFDVLVFPYDWRLSAYWNAVILRQEILKKWFGGKELERNETVAPDARITFVAHSLGGLVSRALIEGTPRGSELAKRLITIATPHLGVPQAYIYMVGRLQPFGDDPFQQWSRQAIKDMAEVGPASATAALDPAANLIPAKVQHAVVNHMASTFELLPTYDTVETRKGMEPRAKSYQGHKHTGTGMPAMDANQYLRNMMQPESALGSWLAKHGIDYHFVATSGYSTMSGYHRDKNKVLVTKQGDGTVPLVSAHPYQGAPPPSRVAQKQLPKGRLGHQRMCEREDVLAYVLQVMGRSTAGAATLRRAITTDELVEAADKVLRQAEEQNDDRKRRSLGTVLSVVTLEAQPSDNVPLIDATTETKPDGGRRLVNPPAHLSASDVYTVATTRYSLDYVWISSGADRAFSSGGILILPQPDERRIHLVTFNVGRMDQRFKGRCTNVHHAEIQLDAWLLAQPRTWRERLALLDVVNRSRKPGNKGFSPCKACCGDLSGLPAALRHPSRKDPFSADITWGELYTKMADCGHPTDKEGLRLMEKGGWKLHPPADNPAP